MTHVATHHTLMPTLAAIHERRAVRDFTEDQVSERDVSLLLDAAVCAPSAMNSQPWAFVVLQDPAVLERFEAAATALIVADPPSAEMASIPPDDLAVLRDLLASPGFTVFHGAPTVIVIYATSPTGVSDCFLAAQNLMLAACALDLGTCPVGLAAPLFGRPEIKSELDVPPEFVPALTVVVGVPSPESPSPSSGTQRPVHPKHDPPTVLCHR